MKCEKKLTCLSEVEVKEKEMYRDLVRPVWAVAEGGMCFHTTTVICQDCQEATCVFVSAHLTAVSRSNAGGGKTITTHLPATISAYTSGKQAAKRIVPLLQPQY